MNPLNRYFLVFSTLLSCSAFSQITENKDDLLPNMTASQQAFTNIPEEDRKLFIEHVTHANRMFRQKRIFECLEKLNEAQKLFDKSPEVYNLRGSCYVEMRSFDKALEQFEEAMKLSPNNAKLLFNIGEVYFVTKEWKRSLDTFNEVLKKIPETNVAMSRLVEFKILLCLKKVGRSADARIFSEKYDFLDDSPFYYYAKAAIAYDDEDLQKAEEWLATASRIFRNPAAIAPWQDTLVEYGYIKSFYGGEIGDEQP